MQGFNRYYAPDYDPSGRGRGNLNRIAGHSVIKKRTVTVIDRETGATSDVDGQVVRFALPCTITCSICNVHSARGTRYNATKVKNGNYLEHAVWEFAIKCYTCTNEIHIRTDPQHATYVVVSGATGRCVPGNATALDSTQPVSGHRDDLDRRAPEDAMVKLEKEVRQKHRIRNERDHLAQLLDENERQWSDPYERSQQLRRTLRTARRADQDREAKRGRVEAKLGLKSGILLDSHDGDRHAAREVQFDSVRTSTGRRRLDLVRHGSIFATRRKT